MKNPQLITLALLLTFNINLSAQKGLQRMLTTSIQFEEDTELEIDLQGEVDIKEWNKDYIRVVIEINTNLEHERTFDLLVANDRYFLDKEVNHNQVTRISSPFLKNEVTINKIKLKENIRYKIFVPHYVQIKTAAQDVEIIAQIISRDK